MGLSDVMRLVSLVKSDSGSSEEILRPSVKRILMRDALLVAIPIRHGEMTNAKRTDLN